MRATEEPFQNASLVLRTPAAAQLDESSEEVIYKELEGLAGDPVRENQVVLEFDQAEREKMAEGEISAKKHDFDKEIVDFNLKFEEQIEKYISANAYTDRKFSGSFIGTGIFGGSGFLIF
jgi:hypothetical protein